MTTDQVVGVNVDPETLGRWLVCAARYALPRQSYMVAWIAEDVRRFAGQLPQNDVTVLLRDIDDALGNSALLKAACDRTPWKAARAALLAVADRGLPKGTP